ncbi:MAG: hypothetical protein RBS81_05085 [Tenuifilaceae bacterium]|jgi:hypothetical protein|nr:hypothetical protein [Tenuifilaceae bacterium]
MNKCKCIKLPNEVAGIQAFKLNAFYDYDYVPPMHDNPSYYKVFSTQEGFSRNFNIKEFKEHFKTY